MNNNRKMTSGQQERFTNPTGRQAPPEVAELADRLRAGAHERCAGCLCWVDKKSVGAIATFAANGSTRAQGYVNCKRCLKNAARAGKDGFAELHKKVESYLSGGE